MQWATFLNKNLWILYLLGGLLLGVFIGYKVLPKAMPPQSDPLTADELQTALAAQQQLEAKLTAAVNALDRIDDAQVQLPAPQTIRKRYRKATVTVPHGDALSHTQLEAIAQQVASGVEGVAPGSITIIDATAGAVLNPEEVHAHERKTFWTNIAINIARILGIIAALVTLRFIFQAIDQAIHGKEATGS